MTYSNVPSIIPFHGHNIITLSHNSKPYVAMKPIVEAIGLDWHAQRQRINRNLILNEGAVMITLPSNGGLQEMQCLPLSMLNGWLFGVDVNRVKPEIRDTLIQYQRECFDVLYRYWTQGEATNSKVKARPTTKALPNCLTVEQQKAIQALVKTRVDLLPEDKRAKGAITLWSALKSKFGASYKEIPESEFTEALSLVARVEIADAIPHKMPIPEFVIPDNSSLELNTRLATSILDQTREWSFSSLPEDASYELNNALSLVQRCIVHIDTMVQHIALDLIGATRRLDLIRGKKRNA